MKKQLRQLERRLVRLGDCHGWSMVRDADNPYAPPFVISRPEWDRLPTTTF
jgi:hypothetical protein